MKDNFLWLAMAGLIIYSCTNPLDEQEEQEQREYEDSVAQAGMDQLLIDEYISDNELGSYEIFTTETGLRYLVTDAGSDTRFPVINNILSVDFSIETLEGEIIDTSMEELLLSIDSAQFEEKGISVADTMEALDEDLENTIIYLNAKYTLDSAYFNSSYEYDPLTYSYRHDGKGLDQAVISGEYRLRSVRLVQNGTGIDVEGVRTEGLNEGLQEVMKSGKLSEEGTALILAPSALIFGASEVLDAYNDELYTLLEPNTSLVYRIRLSAIRP